MSFDFDLDGVLESVKKHGAKRVLLQFPDGLKPFSTEIVNKLEERLPGVEFVISGEHSYGSCDIAEDEAELVSADLIIHFGHSPYTWYFPKFPTTFIEVKADFKMSEDLINSLLSYIDKYSAKSVSISSTLQYANVIQELRRRLEEKVKVYVGKPSIPVMKDGQILGCDLKAVNINADLNVHVSGGMFHALGVGLATGKPTVKVDPDLNKVQDISPEVYRVLKIRYAKVMEAMYASNWIIVQGLKVGQNRPYMVKYLKRGLESKNRKVYIITSKLLTKDVLRNVDRSYIDAYVVTSCPRIPTDDLYDFEKPVLTPGEAKMIINEKLDTYIFPW
ncbi:diphthamide biosynthesis enzyme Dph2 [Sulfolobales archaeon HS-7]|nr:diphthamide biosynthesis enzyme Dph2 [Sulfolobales archaeon HS-7]